MGVMCFKGTQFYVHRRPESLNTDSQPTHVFFLKETEILLRNRNSKHNGETDTQGLLDRYQSLN